MVVLYFKTSIHPSFEDNKLNVGGKTHFWVSKYWQSCFKRRVISTLFMNLIYQSSTQCSRERHHKNAVLKPSWKGKYTPQSGEKYLPTIYLTRNLHVECIKNYYNSVLKKPQMTQFYQGQQIWREISPKKICKWPITMWNDAQHLLLIREINTNQNNSSTNREAHYVLLEGK